MGIFKKKTCVYCNDGFSQGNQSIYRDNEVDVYIVRKMLYILKSDAKIAKKNTIRFCPICGRRLK